MGDFDKREVNARKDNSDEQLEERQSEATSDETVSDLDEAEKDLSSTDTGDDPGPSPDGALDESDEAKDAGPM